jgi:colicin import membrane protein
MAEQKESSVLFSLKELMNLEEDRIRQEENDRQKQIASAEQARLDIERRAREEEEARIRAEEDRRRQEESRLREESARLDAIRTAEVEKARLEAENAARAEAMKRQQEHERQIHAISHDEGKKKLRNTAIGVGALLVVALVGGGFAIFKQSKEREESEARHMAQIAQQTAEREALTRKLEEQNAAVKGLEDSVANAKSEVERAAAREKLAAAQRQAAATRDAIPLAGGGRKANAGPGAAPKPACTCTPGDPLCSCL